MARRTILAVGVIATIGLYASVTAANATDVYIRSKTPLVSKKTLRNDLVAFQTGQNKLERWWGGEHIMLKLGKAPRDAYQITIQPPAGIFSPLGYHFIGPYGPYAVVFWTTDWTITLTHELFEMAVDPYINRTAQGSRFWLVEVADQVELFHFPAIARNGRNIQISDFVGPNWYKPGSHGPYDYMHLVQRPEQILTGGYVSYWDGTDWIQILGG